MRILTKEKLKAKPFQKPLPHVVILGAGASKAAMPNGDKFGKLIPLMDDLPQILGTWWPELLRDARPPNGNFEATFSWIRKKGCFQPQLSRIENLIESYFMKLELPDHPTIYDYLVLGLRGKDVVATFNWDPFLIQAHRRNREVAELPDIRFLHGSVAFATCADHDILGDPTEVCPKCSSALKRGRLFFPDEDKDYTKDSLIFRDWEAVTAKLQKAFHLTIFGYSDPATDYNARKLLLEGWVQTPIRDFSHAEIIDVKSEDLLRESWAEFFPHYHGMIVQDFWKCSVARWPRRTAEWKLSASLNAMPAEFLGPFKTDSLCALQEWSRQLAATESEE